MAREVIINNIDYNDKVESVIFHSSLGEGSGVEIFTLPSMPNIAPYSPIIVKMNSKVVFKGYVGAPEHTMGGQPCRILYSKYECYDDGNGFKDVLINGEYAGTPQEVITLMIESHRGEYPQLNNYTFFFQSSINVSINIAYTYEPLNSVFDQIASQYSGYWSCSPDNKIYFYQTSISDVTGANLTVNYMNVQTPYKHRKPTDSIINKVTVLGGESDSLYEAKWTYDGSENIWYFPNPPMSVTSTINGDPAYLIAEGYSGDPYSASDQDLKNTYDNKAFSTGGTANPKGFTHVVVHHVAAKTFTLDQLRHCHMDPPPAGRGWSSIGYHWYVRKDGSVYSTCPETEYGAHVKGHNGYTIGIGCEGDYENFDTSMPTAQFNALTAKILDVMNRMGMSKRNLMFHGELTNTACPGKYFPKDALRKAVLSGSASNYSYTPQTSVAGADSTKRLIYNLSEGYLKIDPQYPPATGSTIGISYTSSYVVSETVMDVDSIRQYGRVVPYTIADAGIATKENAIAMARAMLNQSGKAKETLTLDLVYYQQLFSGDKVYLPWLNQHGLVISTQGELTYNKEEYNRMRIEVQLI